ncbi:MAG: hypothetical protein A4E30_00255 [Methanomassiliicoccales archaeon PtaB.Bin215]|nr:MAG: hypothetical protein A4E30_00255 [Methanomassiliicoccales archaeon PtaB.Bin215]
MERCDTNGQDLLVGFAPDRSGSTNAEAYAHEVGDAMRSQLGLAPRHRDILADPRDLDEAIACFIGNNKDLLKELAKH